eukprot:gnl/MRDRNA2_/MRDRNA2_133707_c0_seq1.p1 gnl/MRDRNA2_/MRDRNA2_133707_c0~~gnl/MRDRNA2_/MRDRNA2_133707_c0_seq1.p1  ORF type:complete len:291 (+),score=38.56 gnl/MRDRNA2_/MRDRNA2_133707_c0_seq1:90-962(+)
MMKKTHNMILLEFFLNCIVTSTLKLKVPDKGSVLAVENFQTQRPISQEDLDFNEKSGLRSSLEDKIKALSMSAKPTLYFIGESLMMRQAVAACSILTNQTELEKVCSRVCNGQEMEHVCESDLGKLVYIWSDNERFPFPQLANLQERHSAATIVYFGESFHSAESIGANRISLQHYEQLMNQTLHAYARDAPQAQIKVFLGHRPCPKKWMKDVRDSHRNWTPSKAHTSYVSDELILKMNALVSKQVKSLTTPTKIVDGYEFTKKLGCEATADGRHYDKYLFQALMNMLEA